MKSFAELCQKTPLLTKQGYECLKEMQLYPTAPKWNAEYGDQITQADFDTLKTHEKTLTSYTHSHIPNDDFFDTLPHLRSLIPAFQQQLPLGMHYKRDWEDLDTTSRADLAERLEQFMPHSVNANEIMMYATSGTTGHAILIPRSTYSVGMYHILLKPILEDYGLNFTFPQHQAGNFLLGMQAHTVMHTAIFTLWNHTGHTKINLHPNAWHDLEHRLSYLFYFNPPLLTGDPISFAELLQIKADIAPKLLMSTSLPLPLLLKNQLEKQFKCPVIDWYSLNETGPIAYSCKKGHGFHLLPSGLFVEVLDEHGKQVEKGERGEITVSGMTNKLLPLLRYRTGDFAKMCVDACPCGNTAPLLYAFEGRKTVLFRHQNGSLVNQVDIARILREFPVVQHSFRQKADKSCELILKTFDKIDLDGLRSEMLALLGNVKLRISIDSTFGEQGKVIAYQSEN